MGNTFHGLVHPDRWELAVGMSRGRGFSDHVVERMQRFSNEEE